MADLLYLVLMIGYFGLCTLLVGWLQKVDK